MKKLICLFLSIIFVFTFMACNGNGKNDNAQSIIVDFSAKTGVEVQNIKKIDMFSPTWEFCGTGPGMVNYESVEQLKLLDDLQSERFRIDLMMGNGGIGSLIGANGNNGKTDKEFGAVYEIAKVLQDNNSSSMFVLCDVPPYAQAVNSSKQYPDEDRWYEICYNIARYLKDNGIRNTVYETWNEPDLGTVFWGGTLTQMTDMSIIATKAIREADPYASVAALGLCWPLDYINKLATDDDGTMSHWNRFWTRSVAENAMPDALSWHYYGQPEGQMEGNLDMTTDFSYWLSVIRSAFNETQNGTHKGLQGQKIDLSTMQQLVTEYHPASSLETREGTVGNVPAMYDSIGYSLDATDLTKVYWACYVSELFGVIDKYTYQKNAGYNVLWSFARLPLERVTVEMPNDELGYYAGIDDHRAGYIVYNKGKEVQNLTLNFNNLPFNAKTLTVYEIAQDNLQTNSAITYPPVVYKKSNLQEKDLQNFNISIRENCGYYFEINDETGVSELEISRSIGDILKKEYYYNDRGHKLAYSDIHNLSLTALVSMADSMKGESAVSMIVDTKKEVDSLKVSYEGWGDFIATNQSALGFKVEYQTATGYEKSVYYTFGGNNYEFILPFAGKSLSNEQIKIDNLNGECVVELTKNAPADWNGIVQISFVIKDAGYGATEKFVIEKI